MRVQISNTHPKLQIKIKTNSVPKTKNIGKLKKIQTETWQFKQIHPNITNIPHYTAVRIWYQEIHGDKGDFYKYDLRFLQVFPADLR